MKSEDVTGVQVSGYPPLYYLHFREVNKFLQTLLLFESYETRYKDKWDGRGSCTYKYLDPLDP